MGGQEFRLDRTSFPVTIRIFSGKDGSELWSTTIAAPDGGALARVAIPGYAGTEHVPVRIRIEYGDGTFTDDVLP